MAYQEDPNQDPRSGLIQQPRSKLRSASPKSKRAQLKSKLLKKRRRRRRLNFIFIIVIIATISLFFWAEQRRRATLNQLEETEARLEQAQGSTQTGDEAAAKVLAEVKKLMILPEDPEPTVATIVDVNKLRETSDFYNQAKNGDALIVTAKRAILYDQEKNLIIDVVPVKLNDEPTPPSPPDPTPPPPPEEEIVDPDAAPPPDPPSPIEPNTL